MIGAPAPTAGSAHPARPATSAHPAGAAKPAGAAGAAAGAAAAAAPFSGKTKLVPFAVGCVLALALADTRAAPVVIAILTGAIIFQLMHL